MAELTYKSPGVSTREIDISQPTIARPTGIPAGIVGTAIEGPAFVPLTISNFRDFTTVFGASDGSKFGPIAVSQWLANANSVTYMRVLGAGNGKKRNASGIVTNAGFKVGDELPQSSGVKGANAYAKDENGILGRTYFLGAFMSESAGSTIFSSAGIQTNVTSSAILRGVLLAPSGVILHLSGNSNAGGNTPTKGTAARASTSVTNGQTGGLTGSLDLSSQEFVLLMNGYNNTDSSKKTYITASLDSTSPNYFANVFNTNPFKIEEEGHLLYASYDIQSSLAVPTGSGIISAGTYSAGVSDSSKEDIVFLLTSSMERGTGSLGNVPDYENFEDRFNHAKTPWIISQKFGASPKNLFKIHLLSDGAGLSTKYKFSIENIKKSNSSITKWGTFDLVVRDFNDTDDNRIVLESFRGLSLDINSDRYIGRVIGDQHVYYNFDVVDASQKLVVDGNYPVRSKYIRVELADDVDSGNISQETLPMGFRGPSHIVTSGSMLTNQPDASVFNVSDAVRGITEIPIPYRETIAIGTGIQKRVNNNLFWGAQFERKSVVDQPNKPSVLDNSFYAYAKHFPDHLVDTTGFAVGDNAGAANVNGSILDSDRFNYNKFSLENIQVRTGSDGYADSSQWLSASYVRNGVIAINATNKTRAFEVNDLTKVANINYAKFTFFAQGGWDGNNILNEEKSKMSNISVKRDMDDPGAAGANDNTVASYKKAVDIMSSRSDIDIQLFAIPGIRHSVVTDYAIQGVEDRFDALYIMDIEERDQYNTVITSSVQKPHVGYTVSSFTNRGLDSSFAAAYFPDVVVKDPSTGTLVQVPPSVAVLGAYAINDKVAYPWFAPAGFTRGALSAVESTTVKLNRTNLDDLYSADINPITEYPGSGLVIWGQKTLQAEDSALDRINVRRMLIDVRRKIRKIANSFIFEPLKEEALASFKAKADPVLQRIKEQQGVARYKVVIDTSTTTQADIDNNTIRGIIWVQPVGAAEFASIDFVIANLGSQL